MEEEQNLIIKDVNSEEDDNSYRGKHDSYIIATPELVFEWKKWFLIQKFSLDTVDNYNSIIKRFVGYKVNVTQKSVDRFRESHMGAMFSSALKSFFKFLVYKKDFPESLLLIRFERNRMTRKLPKIISSQEVELIIAGMSSIKEKLLTQTIYSLALRIEEAFKLTWDNFNWAEWLTDKTQYGKVNLIGTKRGKFRVLPVDSNLMKNLYENHDNKTSTGIPIGRLVFGDETKFVEEMSEKREIEKLNKEQIQARNKKHYLATMKDAYRGVLYKVSLNTIGKKISPHILRHTMGQFLMDHDVPIESIQKLLGHESIATTQIYAQASGEKLKRDLERVKIDVKGINKNKDIQSNYIDNSKIALPGEQKQEITHLKSETEDIKND